MICSSADQCAENILESSGADVKRSMLEGRKRNFDVEKGSGVSGPPVSSRPDEGMSTATTQGEIPTVPPLAPPSEEHVPEIRGHSNSGGGDVAAKMEMVRCNPYHADIDKVVRYTNICGALVSYLPNEDGKLIDTGQIIIAQTTGTQERHLRDDGIVGALCHLQGQVHHFREHRRSDSCNNLPGIRVPKCTRRRTTRIHSETCYQLRGRSLDIVQLQKAKAVMTPLTEQKSLNLHDETTACDQVQLYSKLLLENCSTLPEWDQI